MVSAGMKTGLLMGFGSLFVVIGAVLAILWSSLFASILQQMMILTEDSRSYEMWKETPIPMYLEFKLFNITNVQEILSGENVKIHVQEMGPYVFRERHTKENLTWNDNSTITFYNQRFWDWMPDMSNGSLTDNITSINPVVVTVAYMMRDSNLVIHSVIDVLLRTYHSDMFLTADVNSWLFEGIEDGFLDIAQTIPIVAQLIPFDKFAWFYERNGSMLYDGVFLMNTGAADFSQLGNLEKWQYSNRTNYDGECGAVKGSTGELWAPEHGQEEIYVFASDICSYLILGKDGTEVVEGVEGDKFTANATTFDNGHHYPNMACFCSEVRDEDCLPPGALNVSQCQFGAPAFVSLPHMLYSDPYYPSKIDGLAPTEEHVFSVVLEMLTGMPLAVAAQLQVNLLVRHIGGITLNNQLPDPDVLVPMFWFRQEVKMTPEYASEAKMAVNVRYGMPYAFYSITAIGFVVLLIGVVMLVRRILASPETANIIENSDDDKSQ